METFIAVVTVVAFDNSLLLHVPRALVEEIISRFDGRIVRRNGDEVLAVFGIGASEGDPLAPVKTALALKTLTSKLAKVGAALRIGIATGEATVCLSEAGTCEVEGDPVDLAIRLWRTVRTGGTYMDSASREDIKDHFKVLRRETFGTKGKSQPIEIYELLDEPMASDFDGHTLPPIPHDVRQIVIGAAESPLLSVLPGAEPLPAPGDLPYESSEPGDSVDCTVFAPPAVSHGESFLVQVFAHLPAGAEKAGQLAREFDSSAARRVFRSLESKVAPGARLGFELAMPGLCIDDPLQSMIWKGRTEAVQFGVTVPGEFKPGIVIGTVTMSQNTVPIGHMKFRLQVDPALKMQGTMRPEPLGDAARRYSLAFISYASQDRDKVLSRVQMLKPFGIQYFQDILDFGPGDRWEKELYRHIDESDLFLLFWSTAAKESKWVMEEVKYALARKNNDDLAPPEVCPIIIEGPPVPSPPAELAHLHFNDRLIYFMSGVES